MIREGFRAVIVRNEAISFTKTTESELVQSEVE
jgi:hypothetical protein